RDDECRNDREERVERKSNAVGVHERDRDADRREDLDYRCKRQRIFRDFHLRSEHRTALVSKSLDLESLEPESAYLPSRGQVLGESIGECARLALKDACFVDELAADVADRENRNRNDRERQQHDSRPALRYGEIDEIADGADERGGLLDDLVRDHDQRILKLRRIPQAARDQIAARAAAEERQRQTLQLIEVFDSQRLEHSHAGVLDEVGVEGAGNAADQKNAGKPQGDEDDLPGLEELRLLTEDARKHLLGHER